MGCEKPEQERPLVLAMVVSKEAIMAVFGVFLSIQIACNGEVVDAVCLKDRSQ